MNEQAFQVAMCTASMRNVGGIRSSRSN